MADTRKRKCNSLPVRLMCVVAGTFLPLNLLVIIVAAIVISKASEQVQEAYQREVDFMMERQEEQLTQIEQGMNNLVLSYLTPLTLSESNDTMVSYEILRELAAIFTASGQKGVYYLYDKAAGQIYVKYTPHVYTYREIENLKNTTEGDVPDTSNEWRLCELKGNWFCVKYYEYTNYRIGFLVDLKSIVGQMMDGHDTGLFLSDGSLIAQIGTESVAVTEETWEDLTRSTWSRQAVEWHSEVLGLWLLLRIPRSSILGAIPLFYWILLAVSFLSVFLLFGLWNMLKNRVVKPIQCLQKAMGELEQRRLDYRIEKIEDRETKEFRYLYEGFNRMADEVKDSYEKEIQIVRLQLDSLRLQINPHMLLNSFNMIYSLAQSRNYECIQEFSMYLVEYFRYALKETDIFVPMEKEMAFVESYIGIQKIRFPGAFTSVYTVQPEAQKALVPPLLVQNFVENAMKYALVPGKTIEVLVNIRKEEGKLLISVCDTGSGIREEVLTHIQKGDIYTDKLGQRHIGIWNCRRRMEVFYEGKASMNIISNRGEGTQVWLELPFLTAKECPVGKEVR